MYVIPSDWPSKCSAAFAPRALALLFLLGALAACGGGDGSAQPTASSSPTASPPATIPSTGTLTCETPPEGLQPFAQVQAAVGGTIIGRTDPSFILLQSPDTVGRGFDRWLISGPDLAQTPVITDVIYASGGGGCSSNDRTAVNGSGRVYLRTDIGDRGAGAVLLAGGSLRYTTAPPVTYALDASPLPGIAPSHTLVPALLANVVGSWTLNDLSLNVAVDGALTLRYRGCSLKGSLRVGDGGLYSVTAWYEPGSCTRYPDNLPAFEGVALAYPLAAGGWQMVFAVNTNNGIDFDEILAIGRR